MNISFEEKVLEKLEVMEKQLNEIPEIKKELNIIANRVTKIEEKTTGIETRTTNIERITTILEHEFHKKVSALFDGYEMHEEQEEDQFQKINYLNRKVENHDIRILNLEHKTS